MELRIESAQNSKNYACKIFLYDDFEGLDMSSVSESAQQLLQKKRKIDEKNECVEIETLDEHLFFVATAQVVDFETKDDVRKHMTRIWNVCKKYAYESCLLVNNQQKPDVAYACIESFVLSSYDFTVYKSEQKPSDFKTLACVSVSEEDLLQISTITQAVFFARDVINEPVITLSTAVFAQKIVDLFKGTGAEVRVHNKQWIEQENMGGLLAVNRGSVDEPCFVHIQWNPKKEQAKPLVLVGKGIVFDTGGLSLKTPSTYMETMKADMGGAAAVVGVMKAVVDLDLPQHIHALIPITDNRLSGNAYAPGDVIRMRSGLTVEVLNTDAEGRMILADALDYAKELQPALVIDVATLTGAANAAVGEHAAVYMGTAQEEMERLEKVSLEVWEPLVKLPLWNYYEKQISSEIADIKNVGGPLAGAITAGKFLQKFTEYPWIHMDISGSAFLRTRSAYKGIGGTGFGVRTLVEFVKGVSVS